MTSAKTCWAIAPLLALAILLEPASVRAAGSIFSGLGGYGVFENFTSSRAAGMGQAGLALEDSIALNFVNPAALAGIQQTRLAVGGFVSRQWIRSHQAEDLDDWAQVEYFSLALRLRRGLALGFFLAPYSRVDYQYARDWTVGGVPYYLNYQGSGGLSRAAMQAAVGLGPWGQLGGGLSVIWGQVEDQIGSYSSASGDADVEFINTGQWLAFGGSLGFLLQPVNRLALAGTFEPEVPIQLDRTSETTGYTAGDSIATSQAEYRLAARYSLGLSYLLASHWLVAGQLNYSPWGELKDLPEDPSVYQDAYVLAAGVEWTPGAWNSDRLASRLQYRWGFRWETGYARSQGSAIDGYFVTAGLGFPLHQGRDRLDVSLEYGVRGDLSLNDGQESILKIRLGLNLGGTWFVRPKPAWED